MCLAECFTYCETKLNTMIWVSLPWCANLWSFFFVLLTRVGVWLLFSGLLAHLFCLFYIVREFDRFLQSLDP